MLEPHPVFSWPNEDAVLWRYMDFSRLISLVSTRSLWLSRADLLGDNYEGRLGSANRLLETTTYKDLPPTFFDQRSYVFKELPRRSYVNCWHLGAQESMALWQIYSARGLGLAVQTTFGRLKESLVGTAGVLGGIVKYVDYETTIISEENSYWPLTHKRNAFTFENEFRLVKTNFDSSPAQADLPLGLRFEVDLSRLIQNIFSAPGTADWEFAALQAALTRFDCHVPLVRSSLDIEPLA